MEELPTLHYFVGFYIYITLNILTQHNKFKNCKVIPDTYMPLNWRL